jgi:ATP-dependent helicase/nuclease subunit A
MNIKIISAGAGSGKTYRLTSEMVAFLSPDSSYNIRPSGIIATTFTNKAAAELQERVRVRLLSQGMTDEADDLSNALIGTVHGLGVKLLKRFAFEAGVSPDVSIMADEDQQVFFNQALAMVLSSDIITRMEHLVNRLGLDKGRTPYDWRQEVKRLTDVARTNAFDAENLQESKEKSIASLLAFFDPIASTRTPQKLNDTLKSLLETTLSELRDNDDSTKTTQRVVNDLQNLFNDINTKGALNWHEWIKITKLKPGKSSKAAVETIQDFAQKVEIHSDLHQDITDFITNVFDLAMSSLSEYENYKKRRGLIDYIDMEIHVNRLLNNPVVQQVMTEELDLLMVDEFQDTSPIQLEIFLKLSKFAQISVWVGDPKQSIYGFRGAEPALMNAIVEEMGGVKPEDIQEFSWRSREDIVHATNAIFVKAFPNIKPEQIALKPKREKSKDPIEQDLALIQWHFEYDGKGNRLPGKPWMENAIARNIRAAIEAGKIILPKDEDQPRSIRAGDIAVLCRSNFECQAVAEALHRAGLKAAIARNGLVETSEAKLVLACLKYILNDRDSLSIAEILLLAVGKDIESIIDHRIQFLETEEHPARWGLDIDFIKKLKQIRKEITELSSSEILNLVLETLEVRRIAAAWGNPEQRLSNIDELCKQVLQYEERCNRLHTAASLGGFLLWIAELANNELDTQGSGESPDAVNVLTYHRSKGLEWPMVICHSLEQKLRDNVWGIQLVSEAVKIDLDNILGNRWIRFWANPYSDQIKNTPLENKINLSPAKAKARAEALQEEARLLYVGITRARDYLVIPTRKSPTKWLNRCWHNDEDVPTLDANSHETSWVWNQEVLLKENKTQFFPKIFGQIPTEEGAIEYFEERVGVLQDFHELFIDVYKMKKSDKNKVNENQELVKKLSRKLKPKIGKNLSYLHVRTNELSNDNDNFKIIKGFLIADDENYSDDIRENLATELAGRIDKSVDNIQVKDLISASSHFYKILDTELDVIKIYKNYPVKVTYGGRVFRENIDFVAQTGQGDWLLIDSRDVLRKWEERKKKNSDAAWFYLAELGIKEALSLSPSTRFHYFIHAVLDSKLIEIDAQQPTQLSLGI